MNNTNTKETIPLLATLATAIPAIVPGLLIGGAAFFALRWLLSDDDKQKKPETAPNPPPVQPSPRQFASTLPPSRLLTPRVSLSRRLVPKASVPAPAPIVAPAIKVVPQALPPIKRKVVTREDLANVFQCRAQKLTRTAAVDALKRLGFGKTAAYAALSANGRFASWLYCAPDGIIHWTAG
jgi:hypothetical protein